MPAHSDDKALECSPFLHDLVRRHPEWFDSLQNSGRLDSPAGPRASALVGLIRSDGLNSGLRIFRNKEMMRIVWRELGGKAGLEETMENLSSLAEHCLQATVDHHNTELSEQYGFPTGPDGRPASLVAISMGKLGGRELNLSSDIDLVFAFTEAGQCDGRRRLSNDQFFTRLVRRVIGSLSEINEHGFCFRVDTRLRPFGESGPLVCSFGAMEQYYQREGRDWERYALVKARPVAGSLEAGEELVSRLSPFVYRRYIDFGAVEALHEMYLSLREDSARHDRALDIKRGPGGIREIEFLVQTFQLLRGGREPLLRTPSLLRALESIRRLSILPAEVVGSLRSRYEFLRRLENAVQALHDRQTHVMPKGRDLERVASAMGFDDTDGLLKTLDEVRNSVLAHIETSFPEPGPPSAESPFQSRWKSLRSRDWKSMDAPADPMESFMSSLSRRKLSNRAARRLDEFMPGLLEQLERFEIRREALSDVLNLVLAICRRSAYLSLLVQNPPAFGRMLNLFNESDWIAKTVIRHPALLDELIDPGLGKLLPDREEMNVTVKRILDSSEETEARLLALNHMKRAFSLRIAVAELETTFSPRQVQQSLTSLAESIIEGCYQLSNHEVEQKHGKLDGGRIGIIGYGSLGASEMSYGSDLDLIFLYSADAEQSDGKRPLGPERYCTTVIRRLLSYLTASTASGRLYEVDTRLRPNGRAGLLISSLAAFERYQKEDAWTWELQALSRARPCAGNSLIGNAFIALRREILGRPREAENVKSQVLKMRERLREAHADGDRFKHGSGGLIDIDFIAQLGVLLRGAEDRAVIDARGTFGQLKALTENGWLKTDEFEALSGALDILTRSRHLALLARCPDSDPGSLEKCRDICQRLLG